LAGQIRSLDLLRHRRRPLQRREVVALDLDERDRRRGELARRMHDRVVGILPALILEPT
jgi:hypothetical protein